MVSQAGQQVEVAELLKPNCLTGGPGSAPGSAGSKSFSAFGTRHGKDCNHVKHCKPAQQLSGPPRERAIRQSRPALVDCREDVFSCDHGRILVHRRQGQSVMKKNMQCLER